VVKVYIGLGSNIGNRKKNIHSAIALLVLENDIWLKKISPLYESSPVGVCGQRDYLNCAVGVETKLSPPVLLSKLKTIENKLGRKKRTKHRWMPRTIDLDILFYGNRMIKGKDLIIPHSRLHRRKFVLKPLISLDPGLIHPRLKVTISRLYSGLKDRTQKIREIS
jgi:2-amino-4-hydroxy-6-hydroxymethyldihydropteridine diphosphokinase